MTVILSFIHKLYIRKQITKRLIEKEVEVSKINS